MLSMRLLGTVSLHRAGGDPVRGRAAQPRRLAVLAALGTREEGWSREQLATLLWPESGPGRASHNVADALYVLRRELGARVIRTVGGRVFLDGGAIWCDVVAFSSSLRNGELADAVEVYEGPFLDGFHLHGAPETFDAWVENERRRLADSWKAALEGLAEERTGAEDHRTAVELWRELVDADAFSTRYALALMAALEAVGDPAEALRHGRHHRGLLRDELGLPCPSDLDAALASLGSGGPNELDRPAPSPRPPPATGTPSPSPESRVEDVELSSGSASEVGVGHTPPSPKRGGGRPASHALRWAAGAGVLAVAVGAFVFSAIRPGDPPEPAASFMDPPSPPAPGPGARGAFLRAREIDLRSYLEGTQDSARIHYERAIRLAPGFALAHAYLSLLHSRVYDNGIDVTPERTRLALHHARRALALAPELPQAHLALGFYYYRGAKRYDLALAEFDLAQTDLPDDVDLLYLRALTYRRQGEWSTSTRLLERVVELAPEHITGRGQVLFNYLALGRFEDLQRAASTFREVVPEDPFAPYWLALAPAVRDGDFAAMERLLLPVSDGEPRCPFPENRLYVCWTTLILMGRPAAALRLTDRHSSTWIRSPEVRTPSRVLTGRALALLGEDGGARAAFDDALPEMEEAVRTNPDDPAIRIALTHVYAGLGRLDDAKAEALRAHALLADEDDEFRRPAHLFELATAQAAAGDSRAALETLRDYLAIPSDLPLSLLRKDPRLASVWELPEAASLVDRY